MAQRGRVLTAGPQRLRRVAQAQAALAGALEAKLGNQERQLRALEADRAGLEALLSRSSAIALSVRTPALLRLAALDAEIAGLRKTLAGLQRELLLSRGREKSLSHRAASLQTALARSAQLAEIQEGVEIEAAKASHKQDVVD